MKESPLLNKAGKSPEYGLPTERTDFLKCTGLQVKCHVLQDLLYNNVQV